MTDVPDIADVVVGTPLGTLDHCFVSCVLHVEQSVREFNVRSAVFLKHRTNSDSLSSAIRSITWSTISNSADRLVAFDRAVMFPTLLSVVDRETSNGLMPAVGEFMMLNRLLIVPG